MTLPPPPTTSVDAFQCKQQDALELFKEKNAQYGDNFKAYGVLGVTCEILGALARLPQLVLWSTGHGINHEKSLVDIFTDISNYCMMALICIEARNWDGRNAGDK